jgi:hypothetical protein
VTGLVTIVERLAAAREEIGSYDFAGMDRQAVLRELAADQVAADRLVPVLGDLERLLLDAEREISALRGSR